MRFKYLVSLSLLCLVGISIFGGHLLFSTQTTHAAQQVLPQTKGTQQILPKAARQLNANFRWSHGLAIIPVTTSLYEATTDAHTMYTQGCNAAKGSEGLIVLDWGQPVYMGNGKYGTYDFGGHDDSDTDILHAASNFVLGVWSCRTPITNVAVAIGESNYYSGNALPLTNAAWYADGQQWGQLVNNLNNFVTSNHYNVIGIYGAGDLETGWNTFALTSSLVNGYNNASTITYFDFGDDAPGNWSYYQVWYVAYGARDNQPLPEIYYDADATYDWQVLNVWACNNMGSPMYIRGAMSTFIGNTSAQAWSAMYRAIASNACTAQTLPWYTFLTYMS